MFECCICLNSVRYSYTSAKLESICKHPMCKSCYKMLYDLHGQRTVCPLCRVLINHDPYIHVKNWSDNFLAILCFFTCCIFLFGFMLVLVFMMFMISLIFSIVAAAEVTVHSSLFVSTLTASTIPFLTITQDRASE